MGLPSAAPSECATSLSLRCLSRRLHCRFRSEQCCSLRFLGAVEYLKVSRPRRVRLSGTPPKPAQRAHPAALVSWPRKGLMSRGRAYLSECLLWAVTKSRLLTTGVPPGRKRPAWALKSVGRVLGFLFSSSITHPPSSATHQTWRAIFPIAPASGPRIDLADPHHQLAPSTLRRVCGR